MSWQQIKKFGSPLFNLSDLVSLTSSSIYTSGNIQMHQELVLLAYKCMSILDAYPKETPFMAKKNLKYKKKSLYILI